jgi:hypothetical protein
MDHFDSPLLTVELYSSLCSSTDLENKAIVVSSTDESRKAASGVGLGFLETKYSNPFVLSHRAGTERFGEVGNGVYQAGVL